MQKGIILFTFLLLIGITACDIKRVQEIDQKYNIVQFDAPFKMTQKKGVQFENDALKIIFDSVLEDSRCPEGTTCVWEGQIKVQLTIETTEKIQQVELTRKGGQRENVIQRIGNQTIFLMAINPYPKEGKKIEQTNYKITLVVKKH